MIDRVVVVVPTLNAGAGWRAWIAALREQRGLVLDVVVVDSSSTDDTAAEARAAGFRVSVIDRASFNHGATRQRAVDEWAAGSAVAVFLTQDALLEGPDSVLKLVAAFDDPKVGAALGRQLPHVDAGAIGAHARLFNYPATSRVVGKEDIPRYGIKAAFLSNSFAAYRLSALRAVGGFPSATIMNEDLTVAAGMLLSGWKIAYCADATVRHSHDYTLGEEFRRYFDIGVFFAREPWIRQAFGRSEGEGLRYVRSELRYLWQRAPALIPSAIARTFAKYLAYRLGLNEALLPLNLKRRFSMHRFYWNTHH